MAQILSNKCDNLSATIRILQQHHFVIGSAVISDSGAEGRVVTGSITAPPACAQCAVKEVRMFANPSLYELHDVAKIEEQAQKLRKQLNGWAAMTPHPNVLPLLGVHVGTVEIRLPRPAVAPNIPLRIFSPLFATTVEQWLMTHGRQLSDDAIAQKLASILRQVAGGLAHMHSFGLVHRDLKCINLFCNADASEVVVGDLGLIAHDAHLSKYSTPTGNTIHMAPEVSHMGQSQRSMDQQQQRSKYSVKADVWSLGMLLLEMLQLARSDGLEGYVFNNFSQKVVFDAEHNADPTDTPLRQAEMQRVVNQALEQYPPSISSLIRMTTRQESGEASSLLEVALQLDRRHRASMEHCAVLMDLHQLRDENAVLRDQIAAERAEHEQQRRDQDRQIAELQAQRDQLEQLLLSRSPSARSELTGDRPATFPTLITAEASEGAVDLPISVNIVWTKDELQAKGLPQGRAVRLFNPTGLTSIPHNSATCGSPSIACGVAEVLKPSRVVMDGSMSSIREIGDGFLSRCTTLQSVDLDPLSNATTVGYAFLYGCHALQAVDLSPLSNVQALGHGFLSGCCSLRAADLSQLSKLTSVGGHFLDGCSALEAVNLSPLSRPTDVGDFFLYSCTTLQAVDLTPLSNLKAVGNNFLAGCSALQAVNLSPLPNVKTVSFNFLYGCSALQAMDLSPLSNVTDVGNGFLSDCSALQAVDLTPLSKLTAVGNCFLKGCSALREVDLSPLSNVTDVGSLFLCGCSSLQVVDLTPLSNVTKAGSSFLHECSGLREVICPVYLISRNLSPHALRKVVKPEAS